MLCTASTRPSQRTPAGSSACRRVKIVVSTPILFTNSSSRGARLAVQGHPMVIGEVGEHGVPSLTDMERVIDQGVGVHIRFMNLTFRSVSG